MYVRMVPEIHGFPSAGLWVCTKNKSYEWSLQEAESTSIKKKSILLIFANNSHLTRNAKLYYINTKRPVVPMTASLSILRFRIFAYCLSYKKDCIFKSLKCAQGICSVELYYLKVGQCVVVGMSSVVDMVYLTAFCTPTTSLPCQTNLFYV